MLTLSHPTGNSFVRHALTAFERAGRLDSFYTTLAFPSSIPFKSLRRRSYTEIPSGKVHTRSILEALRLSGFVKSLKGQRGVDAVYEDLDRHVARELPMLKERGVCGVYAYEDGAFHAFSAGKNIGLKNIYDLPIGHHLAAQKIFREEALLKPEWAPTLTGLADSPGKLARKSAELALADHIIVASSFTAKTLDGLIAPHQKLFVVPYGAPTPGVPTPRASSGPLKILYVGSLTQRKGISYLFDAVAMLPAKSYKLTLVGRPAVELSACEVLKRSLALHTHIPTLPHAQILQLMRAHDILIFPSLFEGFGLVLTEALACGLPFIATANTAAPDLITDGREGFIVPLRSAPVIAEKLIWALNHRTELSVMGNAAYAKAQSLGWLNYENSLTVASKL